MTTIQRLDDVFDAIVQDHKQLRGRFQNSFDEVDLDKVTVDQYPLLYAQVVSALMDKGEVEFEYEVVVATLMMEKQTPTLNDIYNETQLILADVIAMLHLQANLLPEDERFAIDFPINGQPFTGRFSNLLAGWGAQVSIRVPLPVNLCDAAFDTITPPSPFLGLPVVVTDGDGSTHEVAAGGTYTCLPATAREGIFYQRQIPWDGNDPGIDYSVFWHIQNGTYKYTPPENPRWCACKADDYYGDDINCLLLQENAFGNFYRFTNDRGEQFVEDFHKSAENTSDNPKYCIDHLLGIAIYVQKGGYFPQGEAVNRSFAEGMQYAYDFSYAGFSDWRLIDVGEYLEAVSYNDWTNSYGGVYAPFVDTQVRQYGAMLMTGSYTKDNQFIRIQTNGTTVRTEVSPDTISQHLIMVRNHYI